MKLDHLEKLYVNQLKDAYSAENQLIKAMPALQDAATAEKLSKSLANHFQETQGHIDRLERIFKKLDFKPGGHRCYAMEGLITEAKEIISEDAEPHVRDAAIICAAQKIEHYEIATYGCLRSWAKLMSRDEDADLLEKTLDEEGKADKKLSELAEQWVNAFALQSA